MLKTQFEGRQMLQSQQEKQNQPSTCLWGLTVQTPSRQQISSLLDTLQTLKGRQQNLYEGYNQD